MHASVLLMGVEVYHRNIVGLQFANKFLNPDRDIKKSITIRRIYSTETKKKCTRTLQQFAYLVPWN